MIISILYGIILLAWIMAIVCYAIPQLRFRRFFTCVGLCGYNGKQPLYIKSVFVNRYIKCITFYSKAPLEEWEKIKPDFELFLRRRIYKIQAGRNMRMTNVYFIQEKLPSFIPWDDCYMLEGPCFAIGQSYAGPVIWDAGIAHHGLIAGSTGGGKTALIRCILHQAIQKQYNVVVFDFKGGGDYVQQEREALKYSDLETGYGKIIISDVEEARDMLLALSIEVKGRLECFKQAGVSNINEYNSTGIGRFIPWLVVIDEAAEILDVKPTDKVQKELYTEINQTLRTLARISRAAGVHILMGFIRPSADVLDGQVKNNLLWRACGYFADPAASRIVLDNDRATELPPSVKGRFIVGEEETQTYYLPTAYDKVDENNINLAARRAKRKAGGGGC